MGMHRAMIAEVTCHSLPRPDLPGEVAACSFFRWNRTAGTPPSKATLPDYFFKPWRTRSI